MNSSGTKTPTEETNPRSGYKPVQQSRDPFFCVKERAGRKAKLPGTLLTSNPTPPITLGPEDGKKTKPEGPSGPLGAPGLGRRKNQKAPVAPWGLQGKWKVKDSGGVCWPVSLFVRFSHLLLPFELSGWSLFKGSVPGFLFRFQDSQEL